MGENIWSWLKWYSTCLASVRSQHNFKKKGLKVAKNFSIIAKLWELKQCDICTRINKNLVEKKKKFSEKLLHVKTLVLKQ
jgi:hypothetical protein